MVEVSHSFERGDRIKVVYEKVEYHPSGAGSETVEKEDVGEIVSKPSRQFDWPNDDFDFDYELERGNAVRSVDMDTDTLAQLAYDAGGDRDFDSWTLVRIERLD